MTELPPLVYTPESFEEHNRLYEALHDIFVPSRLCDEVLFSDLPKEAATAKTLGYHRVSIPNETFRAFCAEHDIKFIIYALWSDGASVMIDESDAVFVKLTFDLKE